MPRRLDLRAELAVGGSHALHSGRVPEIAMLISAQPRRAERLVELMWDDDPRVASRAADVLERVSRRPSPALARILDQYKEALLGLLPDARFMKLRWNVEMAIIANVYTDPAKILLWGVPLEFQNRVPGTGFRARIERLRHKRRHKVLAQVSVIGFGQPQGRAPGEALSTPALGRAWPPTQNFGRL